MELIQRLAIASPAPGTGAEGALRSAVLEARLFGLPATVPAASADALIAWRDELLHDLPGQPRGVDLATLDEEWRETLSWAGIPLARGGELVWGRDIACDATLDRPQISGERLLLPSHATLAECSSLGIKPMRTWVQQRLGVRLQAAAGLRLYVWPAHGLVISHLDVPVGGFLYGPGMGTRMGLTIHPGSWQVVSW